MSRECPNGGGLEEAVEHAISVEKKGISRESVRKGTEVALRQEVQ